ncbi:MAG: ABC transporter ATP-binding protein [Erysipelotrichaceae bacterium]
MLKVENLVVNYGVINAIKGISINIKEGDIVTLIGANGAGKTTIIQAISKIIPKLSGSLFFEGQDLEKLDAKKIVKLGLSQVPEGRRVFADMTVLENLEMGAYLRKDKEGIVNDLKRIYQSFPILKERLDQLAGTLSGGEQQMLAMGRAIMSKPKLLLLDEPSMGLAPIFVKEIFNIIKEINAQGTTILLVEQNAMQALKIADYAYVLETGKIVEEGPAQDLLTKDSIKEAYLGG